MTAEVAQRVAEKRVAETVPTTTAALQTASTAIPGGGASWKPRSRGLGVTAAVLAIGVTGMLVILYAWRLWPFRSSVEYTDDAFVRGNTTVISPQVSGYVTSVLVTDYDQVAMNQPLVTIDDRTYRQKVDEAQAAVDQAVASLDNSYQSERAREADLGAKQAAIADAKAQLVRAEADLQRALNLVADGSISMRERDQALAAWKQRQAAVAEAEAARRITVEDVRTVKVNRAGLAAAVEYARAQLKSAQIDLEHTVIYSPLEGQLGELGVRNGQYVTNGTQLVFLVPPNPWVIANYKEAQTSRMQKGQRVTFTVDALGGARLFGRIEKLAPAAGSEFTVLKPDNATGNFTKVPQRISILVAVDSGQSLAARLRPGMSVEASVDTGDGP